MTWHHLLYTPHFTQRPLITVQLWSLGGLSSSDKSAVLRRTQMEWKVKGLPHGGKLRQILSGKQQGDRYHSQLPHFWDAHSISNRPFLTHPVAPLSLLSWYTKVNSSKGGTLHFLHPFDNEHRSVCARGYQQVHAEWMNEWVSEWILWLPNKTAQDPQFSHQLKSKRSKILIFPSYLLSFLTFPFLLMVQSSSTQQKPQSSWNACPLDP